MTRYKVFVAPVEELLNYALAIVGASGFIGRAT